MKRTLAGIAAALMLVVSAAVVMPASTATAAPSRCSKAFSTQMPIIEKAVSDAYDAFNMGSPDRTEPLMRKAIAAARKALKGTAAEGKTLLRRLIAVGVDRYKVSMMPPILMELQDYQLRGC